jgi:hypothetical protein
MNENFGKCVKGYHLVNTSPINETVWEDINALIFVQSGINVYSKSEGGHLSGMDISSSMGNISNKSAKYSSDRASIDISSYRLTTVCSEKSCGNIQSIVEEINKRKNFDYYSLIIRDETTDKGGPTQTKDKIHYDWLLVPSDYNVLDPAAYEWVPTMGQRGKNKDMQVGWHTNEINGCKMSIRFSMSSQLWMHIDMTGEIKKYIIASVDADKVPKYNYMQLYDIYGVSQASSQASSPVPLSNDISR